MRAHQPGAVPLDIPEEKPNPAYWPERPDEGPSVPERPRIPERVPEKVPANTANPGAIRGFSFPCFCWIFMYSSARPLHSKECPCTSRQPLAVIQ